MSTATKLTIKELRAEARRLGITADSFGGPIEDLLRTAQENADPLGYLAIHAPAGEAAVAEHDGPEQVEEPSISSEISAPLEEGKQQESDAGGDPPEPPAAIPLAPILVSLSVPVAQVMSGSPAGYCGRHVELRLDRGQAFMLRAMHTALDARGERLANGRRIIHRADALKWLLEQIGAAITSKS